MCQARGAWADRQLQVRLKRGSGQGLTLSVPGAIRRCRKGLEGLAGSGFCVKKSVRRRRRGGRANAGELGRGAGCGGAEKQDRQDGWRSNGEPPGGLAHRSGGGGLKGQRRALRGENRSSDHPCTDSTGIHISQGGEMGLVKGERLDVVNWRGLGSADRC